MRLVLRLLTGPVLALAIASLPSTAGAQSYPTKPIRVVFPYPAGSALDVLGRMIIDRAAKIVGQPFVLENRPGANGIVGTTYVASASPDGYTICLTTTSAFLLNSFLRKDLPYDPAKSFEPITAAIDIPVALMVTARVPARTTREFVEYLKKTPDAVNYASVGNGSFNHLLMEQFKMAAGVDMVHVPYQGAAPIVTELMAGRVDAVVFSVGSVLDQWRSGQVKVLSYMSTARTPVQPDVPAITEEFPNMHPFGNWMGFVAPAKTPDLVIKKLNDAIVMVLQDQAVRERIKDEQWSVIGSTPEAFRAMINRDLPIVAAAFGVAGINPD
jgi:tripartite-type tricarboxylate transporter receptor subunit TctC